MNPVLVLILFLLIYKENNRFPNYYDTFQLEKLLNQLQYTVNSLDKINHLNQLAHTPVDRGSIVPTIEESIHTVKPLLPSNSKPIRHLDDVESLIGNIQKVSNVQNLLQTYGPLLKPMLASITASTTALDTSLSDSDSDSSSSLELNPDSDSASPKATYDDFSIGSLSDYINKM